jgi:CubicO group peptidase (beta-lactamase class C family)
VAPKMGKPAGSVKRRAEWARSGALPAERIQRGGDFGGNNMRLSPRALLRFGELYRNDGMVGTRRVLPAGWVEQSWTQLTTSRFSGDGYGYGWFIGRVCGMNAPYARGFGGQYVYLVPPLVLTIVITSDTSARTRVGGYREQLAALVKDEIVPAALKADGRRCEVAD